MLIIHGPPYPTLPPGIKQVPEKDILSLKYGLLFSRLCIDLHKISCLSGLLLFILLWVIASFSSTCFQYTIKKYNSLHPNFDKWQLQLRTLRQIMVCIKRSYFLLIWGSYISASSHSSRHLPHSCEGAPSSFLHRKSFWGERRQAK